MKVYVAIIDYFYDDYKRSEGSSDIIGLYKNREIAYKNVLKTEYEKNIDGGQEKRKVKYETLFKSLDTIETFSKKFLEKWEEAREEYLGNPEFGSMYATGHRFQVSEQTLNDE